MNRRRFLAVGASAVAAAAAVGVFAWQIEPYWLDVVRRPMPLENLPAAAQRDKSFERLRPPGITKAVRDSVESISTDPSTTLILFKLVPSS